MSTEPAPQAPNARSPIGAPVAAAGFVLVALAALVMLQLTQGLPSQAPPPDPTQPPLDLEAAQVWLQDRSGEPMDPTDPAWIALTDHPGVVGAWRDELLSRPTSPAGAWALAVFGQDPAWLGLTAPEAGLDFELAAVLALPAAAEAVAVGCPGLPARLSPLCSEPQQTSAARALDTVIARQLGSEDPVVAGFALSATCTLGTPRGVIIGQAARDGLVPGVDLRLQRLRGLLARACSLDRQAAVAELEAALGADEEFALVAATELARLESAASAPALNALAARLGDTGDALLVRYAAAVARGEGQHFADEVDGNGL